MAASRRVLWLGGALLVAIAVAIWSRSDGSAPAVGASASRPTRPAAQGRAAAEDTGPVDVNLDVLKGERHAPQDGRRNPFRFERAQVDRSGPAPETGAAQVLAAPAPNGSPQPPPIALKFIGVVERSDGTKVAILTGASYTLYGQEGAAVDGRYRILKIGVESLEIAHLDGRGRQTIKLTGQ